MAKSFLHRTDDGRVELRSPVAAPAASAFLWNRNMLAQVNCRGFVRAQYMNPEPTSYSYGPVLEAKTFMQPEMPLYAHHPGRFVYVKDEITNEMFSAPYEPARQLPDDFVFSAGDRDIEWRIRHLGLSVRWRMTLPDDEAAEIWTLDVVNESGEPRKLAVYPFFSIGYMSWMNQSARYREDLGALIASSVTPYQKVEDYERVRGLRDWTALLHDTAPSAWDASLAAFEGEGGLSKPDGVLAESLACMDAAYEMPAAVLQYRIELDASDARRLRFVFAPAADDNDVNRLRRRFFADGAPEDQVEPRSHCIETQTPDEHLDHFVNHWLGRQVRYLGTVNRLTTDPQTRNFLQDRMGMAYVDPASAREAFLAALAQQNDDGSMPDGIVLSEGASLKYINQVPHTDHNIWLPVCLQAYLDETADYAVLDERVGDICVFDRVTRAMEWLDGNRDDRGLSLMAQGDWCDPMNMVGHKGKGVSGWLTIATARAARLWAGIALQAGRDEVALRMEEVAAECTAAAQEHLWDGDWFARGISDDGRAFGVAGDDEGRVFLNPQSWALLAGIANADQESQLIAAVDKTLDTPAGVTMLGPPYTHMHEHVGRLTQKFPGSAENGAVYNHAATFYIHALYRNGHAERAFALLRRMIPARDDDDLLQRGQLPVFVPNYYRGAVDLHPRTAGRSSQLPNTGAAPWLYRIIIEQLFGLRGTPDGLSIRPALPAAWPRASVRRQFRGAMFSVNYERTDGAEGWIDVDGARLEGHVIREIRTGHTYDVRVAVT